MALFSQKESEGEGGSDVVPPFIISCLEERSTKSSPGAVTNGKQDAAKNEVGHAPGVTEKGTGEVAGHHWRRPERAGGGRRRGPGRRSGHHAPTLPKFLPGLDSQS